jgi:hypothetical protein
MYTSDLIGLSAAARLLPPKRFDKDGKPRPVHPATVLRWVLSKRIWGVKRNGWKVSRTEIVKKFVLGDG